MEQSQLVASVDRLTHEIQAMRIELDEAREEIAWAMRNVIVGRPGEGLGTTAITLPEHSTGNPSSSIASNDRRLKPPPGQLF